MPTFWEFVWTQLTVSLPYPEADFSGQTIIVTGSNVGLGLEAARHFTRLNAAKVILAVRSLDKGDEAKKSIEASTKRSGVVEVWQLDLCSYESVKQFAKRAEALPRLDVLLENAAIATDKWRLAEGTESTITTNVISTFLLAVLLLPKLKESANKYNVQPHLSIVTSEVHFWAQFKERAAPDFLEALNDKTKANMEERYYVSKLLEVFLFRELAARNTGANGKSNVIINFLNPGLCHSSLSRDSGMVLHVMKFFLARSTEVGSRTLVTAAAAGPESHGGYMTDCVVKDPAPMVLNEPQTQKMVWDSLTKKLEAIQPGILANV